MLAEIQTIDDAKELMDIALTAADWAKRKKLGEEAIQYARSYALEAEKRIGELLKATERAKGGQPYQKSSTSTPGVGVEPSLKELGITWNQSSDAQFLADLPEEEQEKVKTGKTSKQAAKRKEKKKEDSEAIESKTFPVIEGKFKTILIDPPCQQFTQLIACPGLEIGLENYLRL